MTWAICRLLQLLATGCSLSGWSFNPKVAGSIPARPIRSQNAREPGSAHTRRPKKGLHTNNPKDDERGLDAANADYTSKKGNPTFSTARVNTGSTTGANGLASWRSQMNLGVVVPSCEPGVGPERVCGNVLSGTVTS